jgi:hypothetical protein
VYQAVIVKLAVRDHPNADRLKLGTALGNQVVVGSDTQDGVIGIFFPTDGRLTPAVLEACDLLPRKNEAGERIGGGFFAENGRVKAQKFRGERSDGFFLELEKLAWTNADLSALKVGDTLTSLNGIELCSKYETPATVAAKAKGVKSSRNQTVFFKKHVDTEQFRLFASHIQKGALIHVDEKDHGTSFRVGYVLDEETVPLRWWQKLLRKKPVTKLVYTLLVGSKNVILNRAGALTYYGGDQFRWNFAKQMEGKLYKGETLYGEHCGYTDTGALIMQEHDTNILADKAILKQYGKTMRYTYGTQPNETRSFIYRITMTNEDGVVTELSQAQARRRAAELGVEFVAALVEPFVYDGNEDALRSLVELHTDGVCTVDEKHIREGVVVRAEQPDGTVIFLKNKSLNFGRMEGYIKDNDQAVDLEEIS